MQESSDFKIPPWGCLFYILLDRCDPRNLPLFPHFIDSFLDVVNVFGNEMGEAALRLQKFLNRSSAFGCLAAIVAVDDLTFDDLEERIKSRLDSKLTDLMRIAGMEIPPLRTRIVRVDERGTSNGQSLADLVHVVHRREGGTGCRNILTCGMPDRQHSGDVLLPPALHDAML